MCERGLVMSYSCMSALKNLHGANPPPLRQAKANVVKSGDVGPLERRFTGPVQSGSLGGDGGAGPLSIPLPPDQNLFFTHGYPEEASQVAWAGPNLGSWRWEVFAGGDNGESS